MMYDNMGMNVDLEENLKRLTTGDREQRLGAASQFQRLLLSNLDMRVLCRNPFQILYQLDEQFFARFLDWVFENYEKHANDDIKSLYFRSLVSLYSSDAQCERQKLDRWTMRVLSELRKALEMAGSAILLNPLLDLSKLLALGYPALFQPHFQDISDIIIGWCIDVEQKRETVKKCEEILLSFKSFWIADPQLSAGLLKQFLEDAEAYAEDMAKSKVLQGHCSKEECAEKISSLLNVHRTVLSSLVSYFRSCPQMVLPLGEDEQELLPVFLFHSMSRLHESAVLVATADSWMKPNVLLSILRCCSVIILSSFGEELKKLAPLFQNVCSHLYEASPSRSCVVRVLLLIRELIGELSSDDIALFTETFVGSSGLLFRLRRPSYFKAYRTPLAEIYRLLVKPKKGIGFLQIVYSHILSEMEWCLRRMQKFTGDRGETVKLVSENVFSEVDFENMNPHECEENFIFLVAVLMEIGNTKGSVIAMWALSPSIFELLAIKIVMESRNWMSQRFPGLQSGAFSALRSHCERHDHFLSSCNLLKSDPQQLNVLNQSPSSKNFGRILDLLSALIISPSVKPYLKESCLSWLSNLMTCVVDSNCTELFGSVSFQTLACRVVENAHVLIYSVGSEAVTLCVNRMLSLASDQLSLRFWEKLYQACLFTAGLVAAMELHNIISERFLYFLWSKSSVWQEDLSVRSLRSSRQHVTKCGQMYLSSYSFSKIAAFLLHLPNENLAVNKSDNNSVVTELKKWKTLFCHMFRTSNRNWKKKYETSTEHVGFLMFWATWQAAQYCVHTRLKTPLGKPQETLSSIECAIKELANDVIAKNMDPVVSRSADVEEEGVKDWPSVRMLLQFLDALEKHMYVAYEGAALAMYTTSKAARAFFLANRETCLEWLTRIRLAAMTVALHNQHYGLVVRLGWTFFQDVNCGSTHTKTVDEKFLILITKALVHLDAFSALEGVESWLKSNTDGNSQWISPAIETAKKRYEHSATLCKSELSKWKEKGVSARNNLSPLQIHFLVNEAINCYMCLENWEETLSWMRDMEDFQKEFPELEQAFSADFTLHHASIIAELSTQSHTTEAVSQTYGALSWSLESVKARALVEIAKNDDLLGDEPSSDMNGAFAELLRCNQYAQLLSWPPGLSTQAQLAISMLGTSHSVAESNRTVSEVLLQKCKDRNLLSKYLTYLSLSTTTDTKGHIGRLECMLSGIECKNRNFVKAENYLWSSNERVNSLVAGESLSKDLLSENLLSLRLAEAQANLYYEQGKTTEAFDILCNVVSTTFEKISNAKLNSHGKSLHLGFSPASTPFHSRLSTKTHRDTAINQINEPERLLELVGRSVLSLVRWMSPSSNQPEISTQELLEIFSKHEDSVFIKLVEEQLHRSELSECGLGSESVVGALLVVGTHIAPQSAASIEALADWSFAKAISSLNSTCDVLFLSEEEQENVKFVISKESLNEEDQKTLIAASSSFPITINDSKWKERLLKIQPTLCDHSLMTVLHVRTKAVARVFKFLEVAAKGYLRFLQLSVDQQSDDAYGPDCGGNVTAALRLLKMLVKFKKSLGAVFDEGLAKSYGKTWKKILPQILTDIGHPDEWVRQKLMSILCPIMKESPHVLLYQVVVGVLNGSPKTSQEVCMASEKEEEPGKKGALDETQLCSSPTGTSEDQNVIEGFQQLLECSSNKLLVDDLKKLVVELQRITLLRDELWLSVLTYLQQEMDKRIENWRKSVERIDNNDKICPSEKQWLKEEKGAILVRLINKVIDGVCAVTCVDADTPHDQWFLDNYSPVIQRALEYSLRQEITPQEAWSPYKQLLSLLLQRSLKKANQTLDLKNISPYLSKLSATQLPIPAVQPVHGKCVFISHIERQVIILPTKTKPKKLAILGSDGKRYSYLLKGLEDLNLDERIMQLLNICNDMLLKNQGICGQARHYSVIPLGPRAGLIEWVDGATPLFYLYKRWQLRHAISKSDGTEEVSNPAIPRPSDLYYRKLIPELEKKGIRSTENRKQWPLAVQRQVLSELIAETPKDLLQKEFWCLSTDASEWWDGTERFARSVAIMSVIGYIIGLGDRHLDNVLIDLQNSEVVHVDYNVCFEKGARLLVPERVPFRMTQNIEAALGLTGVEGTFRATCEVVLAVLRSSRDTLLSILDSQFVFDCTTKWSGKDENILPHHLVLALHGNSRKNQFENLAYELACRMFKVGLTEIRSAWLENKQSLRDAFIVLQENLQLAQNEQEAHIEHVRENHKLVAVKDLLSSALVSDEHPLYSLPQRLKIYSSLLAAEKKSRGELNDSLLENSQWASRYKESFESLRKTQSIKEKFLSPSEISFPSSLAVQFLQSAGQTQLLSQAQEVEKEFVTSLETVTNCGGILIQLFDQYTSLQHFMPMSRFSKHPTHLWQSLLSKAASAVTLEDMEAVITEIKSKKDTYPAADDTVIRAIWTDLIGSVQKLIAGQEELVLTWQPRFKLLHVDIDEQWKNMKSLPSLHCWASLFNVLFQDLECVVEVEQCMLKNTEIGRTLPNLLTSLCDGGILHFKLASFLAFLLNAVDHLDTITGMIMGKETEEEGFSSNFVKTKPAIHILKKVGDGLVNLGQTMSGDFIPLLWSSAVREQHSFQYLLTSLQQIVEHVGMTPVDMLEQLCAVVHGTDASGEVAVLTIRAAQLQYKHLMENFAQSENAGLDAIYQAMTRLHNAYQSFQDSAQNSVCLANNLDLNNAGPADIQQLSRLLTEYGSEVCFLVYLQFILGTTEACSQFTTGFISGANKVAKDSASLYFASFLRPQEFVLTMYLRGLNGVFSRILSFVAVSLLTEFIMAFKPDLLASLPVGIMATLSNLQHFVRNMSYLTYHEQSEQFLHFSQLVKECALTKRVCGQLEPCAVLRTLAETLKRTFVWIYQDVLTPVATSEDEKTGLLGSLKEQSELLLLKKEEVIVRVEALNSLTNLIVQRLKWAAGANPDLKDLLKRFEEAHRVLFQMTQNQILSSCDELCRLTESILVFEALCGNGKKTRDVDSKIEGIIERAYASYQAKESCNVRVLEAEDWLTQFKEVEVLETLTPEVILKLHKEVSSDLDKSTAVLDEYRASLDQRRSLLQPLVHQARTFLTAHQKMTSELRLIMKALSKLENEKCVGSVSGTLSFATYLSASKVFHERCLTILRNVSNLDADEFPDLSPATLGCTSVLSDMNRIYDGLLELDDGLTKSDGLHKTTEGVVNCSNDWSVINGDVTDDLGEPQNSQEGSVWRSISQRLEGKDKTTDKILTTNAQVDAMIKQAKNSSNLALMYEGWTAWV